MIMRGFFNIAIAAIAGLLAVAPAQANQWVSGKVWVLSDSGSYGGGAYGILVTLSDRVWAHGDTSNGPTNCTERFRIVNELQGVDENIKNRLWSLLLSAKISQ
jgi:hypothetical protein